MFDNNTSLTGWKACPTEMRGLFITGTDTNVGKTIVTAGLLRGLRERGVDVCAVKPFQTGCVRREDGSLEAPDVEVYRKALAAGDEPADTDAPVTCIQGFEMPVSPHLAAWAKKEVCDLHAAAEGIARLSTQHEFVLVEGAGGVMVPLARHAMMLDLIAALGMPAIVVARNELGAINHTLLTLAALRHGEVHVMNVVMVETSPRADEVDDAVRISNPRAISEWGDVTITVGVPFRKDLHSKPRAGWKAIVKSLQSVIDEICIDLCEY